MDVKPSYKQTEVGVIPEDWDVKKLGEIGQVVRGGSPRPAGDPKYFNGNFIPWLTVEAVTNIPETQMHVSETVGYLTEEGAKHSRTLKSGTLIIANSGATLGVAKILEITCCANDGIAAIINQNYGDKRFICHFINSKTKYLREVVATGNGQPNLNTSLINEISIPCPFDYEQRAIAAALSDVDALIAALDRLIAKKRDIKQAAMQELLTGKRRLPGFPCSNRYKQTEVGLIPVDWDAKKLEEYLSFISYGFTNPMPTVEHGIYLITAADINNGRIQFCTARHTTEVAYRNLLTQKSKPKKDDILLTKDGSLGRLALVGDEVICINQSVAVMRLNDKIEPIFLKLLMESPAYQDKMLEDAGGSTIKHIYITIVNLMEIAVPKSRSEQHAIAAALSDMDAEIAALDARREKTRALKQGMMQELLTGRIRLV